VASNEIVQPASATRRGFTLLEIVVVVILMGIAAGLVIPALLPPRRPDGSPLSDLVRSARQTAARRGETLYVTISASGQWRFDGAASVTEGPLATGTIDEYQWPGGTLVVSPIGTCAFDVRSGDAARALPLDPLTCEVHSP
jgi:prepilin-type N-terminal cleavage/methylation domain-containing protein